MEKVYHYQLSREGLKELEEDLSSIKRSINTHKFRKYIANKCMDELVKIQYQSLSSFQTEEDLMLGYYMSCNKYEIDDEKQRIIIYNDAMIDVSSKDMSDEKKANYEGMVLSLAKVVEYGVGFIGLVGTPHHEEVEDWRYDVNEYFQKGWVYKNDNGQFIRTAGYEGRMIFYQLKQRIEEKIYDWISEYWVFEKSKTL